MKGFSTVFRGNCTVKDLWYFCDLLPLGLQKWVIWKPSLQFTFSPSTKFRFSSHYFAVFSKNQDTLESSLQGNVEIPGAPQCPVQCLIPSDCITKVTYRQSAQSGQQQLEIRKLNWRLYLKESNLTAFF